MYRRQFLKGSAAIGLTLASPEFIKAYSGMFNTGNNRQIFRIMDTQKIQIGTLPVMRAFAGNENDFVSPFVLFDEFGPESVAPGLDPLRVDAHPHAGVCPTTYFLSGSGHHKDSLNYDFQIGKGEFMMFSSGKGAIHMEESGKKLFDEGGDYHGFQIWLNTPAKHKFDAPSCDVFQEEKMGMAKGKGYQAKIVLGELFGEASKIQLQSPAFYYHIELEPNTRLDIPTDPTHNAFLYLVEGELELVGQRKLKKNQVVFYERGDSNINIYSECGGSFLLLGGQPLDERVYSYGPFVMNNEEQIRECMRAYNSGEMGDPALVNRI